MPRSMKNRYKMYRPITKTKKEKTKKEKLRNILASSLTGAMFTVIPAGFVIVFARWLAVVIIMSGALFGAIYHHVFE